MPPPPPRNIETYLEDELSYDEEPIEKVIENGIDTFDDLIEMSDKDVTGMCEKIRHPGGMKEKGGTGRDRDELVPDKGVKIGYLQEKSLRQLRFYVFHCDRIQRSFDTNTSFGALKVFWNQRFDLEKEGTKADSSKEEIKPLKKDSDVRKALEDLDNLLMNRMGAGGSPLAYVTREKVDMPEAVPGETDPGMGKPSLEEELIRRTKHSGSHWETDNHSVWNIIRTLTHGGPAWNWVSTYQKKRNGREAYIALKGHYLGVSFVAKTISDATTDLKNIFYTGKSRNFDFETFCGKLNKAFTDLSDNGQVYTEQMKVQMLLTATQDPLLEHAKLKVLGDNELLHDYSGTISYLKIALNSCSNHLKSSRNISVLNRGGRQTGTGGNRGSGGRGGGRGGRFGRAGRGGGRGKGQGPADKYDPKDPGRSLTTKAWKEITDEQRATAREARSKKRNVSALDVDEPDSKRQKRTVSATEVADESDDDSQASRDHFRPGDQITRRPNKKRD